MEAITTDEEVGESLEQFCEKDKMYWLLRQDFFFEEESFIHYSTNINGATCIW